MTAPGTAKYAVKLAEELMLGNVANIQARL